MRDKILNALDSHKKILEAIYDLQFIISDISQICIQALNQGNKIILFGNGGSASDAQHIAAELVGRYKKNRISLPAIAITTDSSALTAISNDFGYDYVFSRQIESLASSKDIVIGISTSGKSKSVLNGIKKANEKSCITIGLSGNDGGELKEVCQKNLIVPSQNTARIQEMHILIGHIICEIIDDYFSDISKS